MTRTLTLLTLVSLLSLPAFSTTAQEGDHSLRQVLHAASHYNWGQSRAEWSRIDARIAGAMTARDDTTINRIESGLIDMIGSQDTTIAAKSQACRRLSLIGTDRAVPALAILLEDDELVDMARYALEANKSVATSAALMGSHIKRLVQRAANGGGRARTTLEKMPGEEANTLIGLAAQGADDANKITIARLLGARGAASQRDVIDRLAQPGESPTVRVAALLATVDLADWSDEIDRNGLLTTAMRAAESPDDRLRVLAAIDEHRDPALLQLVQRQMRNSNTGPAAARVVITLALTNEPNDREGAKAAITAAAERFPDNGELVTLAGNAIAQIERNEGFITTWLLSGPYRKDRADDGDTFNFAYAPERGSSRAEWTTVPADALRPPGIINFLPIYGGSDRAAYAKTIIRSDRAQIARLELGSDDGAKVWINGEVVHQADVSRGLTLNQDVIRLQLREGENTLLIKIVQGGGDWQFAARLRDRRGLKIEGVTASTE